MSPPRARPARIRGALRLLLPAHGRPQPEQRGLCLHQFCAAGGRGALPQGLLGPPLPALPEPQGEQRLQRPRPGPGREPPALREPRRHARPERPVQAHCPVREPARRLRGGRCWGQAARGKHQEDGALAAPARHHGALRCALRSVVWLRQGRSSAAFTVAGDRHCRGCQAGPRGGDPELVEHGAGGVSGRSCAASSRPGRQVGTTGQFSGRQCQRQNRERHRAAVVAEEPPGGEAGGEGEPGAAPRWAGSSGLHARSRSRSRSGGQVCRAGLGGTFLREPLEAVCLPLRCGCVPGP
mmetsp:Transcript_64865/g.204974  ORF Transcript_64865/g.204974 Transcript_64865/m.204974 type:complete len:296 (-) Transcript_64865:293-1180(-)